MSDNQNLPNIGTPEEALQKMKDGYLSFLDSVAKFVTIAEFYTDKTHEGQSLPEDFAKRYSDNFQKLKNESPDDFSSQVAFFTLVTLDFVEEIKDNLKEYERILKEGPDQSASLYDQACDYLAIKDEFTDLKDTIDDINRIMAKEKVAETNENDPEYDYIAKQRDENKFGE